MKTELRLETIHANQLTVKQLAAIHTLCNRAYEEDLMPLFKTFTIDIICVGQRLIKFCLSSSL